jgi:hypothetical protein
MSNPMILLAQQRRFLQILGAKVSVFFLKKHVLAVRNNVGGETMSAPCFTGFAGPSPTFFYWNFSTKFPAKTHHLQLGLIVPLKPPIHPRTIATFGYLAKNRCFFFKVG